MLRRLIVLYLLMFQLTSSQDLPTASVIPGSTIISTICDYRISLNLAAYNLDTKCIKINIPSQISFMDEDVTAGSPKTCETVAGETQFSCALRSKTQIDIRPIGNLDSNFVIKVGKILNYKYATFISNYQLFLLSNCDAVSSALFTLSFRMNVSFTPGQFPTKSVTPGSFKVFEEVVYTLELKPEHNIDQNGMLYFEFPKRSFYINTKQGLIAQGYIGSKPSTIPTLTVQDLTTSFSFLVGGLFNNKEYNPSTDGSIFLILSKVHNPRAIALSDSIIVESRNSSGELTIDSVTYGLEVTPITPCDIMRTAPTFPDDSRVRLMTNYYFQATSVLGIYGAIFNLIIEITFPNQIDPVDVSCEYTFLAASSSTTCRDSGQVVTITRVGIYELIQFKILNLRSPTTDITSDFIKFYIYDSNRNLMCANDFYDRITARPNTLTQVAARRPSGVVGTTGVFQVSFRLATELDQLGQFEVRLPRNQVELIDTSDVNSITCSDMSTSVDRCPLNTLSDSEIILTLRQWCGTSCAAGTTVSMNITGLRNPYFADNTVSSSVKIYSYMPGTPNGFVDRIETGVKFRDDLVGNQISTGVISRNTNIVGTNSVITISFVPTIPYTTGFKLVVQFHEGSSFLETLPIVGEASFTSDFVLKTVLTCTSTLYSTDSSLRSVTCTGASQGSPLTSPIYLRLLNAINRYDTKDLTGNIYKLLINTSSDFAIEFGDLTQSPTLGLYSTNSLSNFSITRSNNTVFNLTNILISFTSSTRLPSTAVITVTVPAGIIIQNKNQVMECYKGTTQLTCSIVSLSSSGSVTSFRITDYCTPSGCASSTNFSITLRNLINPSSSLILFGSMQIVTNSGFFDVDSGLADVSLTLLPLTPGRLFDLDIHPMNPSINQSPLYRFTFTTEHPVPPNGYISITYPSQLELDGSQSITLLFGFQSNAVVLEVSGNTIRIKSGFPTGTSAPVLIGFYLKFFRHNSVAQTTGPFNISTRTSIDTVVDVDGSTRVTILANQGSCIASCNACAGTSSTCYSCNIPSSIPLLLDYSCTDICPTHYFMLNRDSSSIACIKCNYYCDECIAADKCTKCKNGFYKWGGDCVEACPDDTVLVNGVCKSKSCSADCGECSKSDYCLNCASNTAKPVFLSDTGTCYPLVTAGTENCGEGYYQDSTGTTCLKCSSVCRDCQGTSSYCTACNTYYDKLLLDLTTNTCVKSCSAGITIQDGLFCRACDASCATCVDLTVTGCVICPSTGTIYKTTTGKCLANCNTESLKNYVNPVTGKYECISSCPITGYFDDNGTCKICLASCLTCNSADKCQTCDITGFTPYFQSSTSLCVSTCNSTEYFNELNGRKDCVTTCPDGSLKFTNPTTGRRECIDFLRCPNTGYFNDSGTCKACLSSCLTCNTSDKCQTCDITGFTPYFQSSTSLCVSSCNSTEYFYELNGRKDCVTTCPDGSLKYTNPTTGRRECIQFLSCPSAKYFIMNSESCLPCDITCLTCGGTSSNCLSCDLSGPFSFLTSDHRCVQQCIAPFEYKIVTASEKRCYDICPVGTYGYDNGMSKDCINECPSKTFKNNNLCTPCWSTCRECSGPTASDCISCDKSSSNPYLTDSKNCVAVCDANFYKLDINNEKRCVSNCAPTYNNYPGPLEKVCIDSCPPYTFLNSIQICVNCDPSCLTCTGSGADKCKSCDAAGTYPYYDEGFCRSKCLAGEYAYTSQGVRYCLSDCPPGTYKLSLVSGGSCVTSCPDGYYINKEYCSLCNRACLRCTGGSNSDCTECKTGYLQHLETQCVMNCPSGFKAKYSVCEKDCEQVGCKDCEFSGLDKCDECKKGYILYNSYCYTACPDGSYRFQDTCAVCSEECRTCKGPMTTECQSCKSGRYLYEGECVEMCPYGFESFNGKCVAGCMMPCATCLEGSFTLCKTCMPENPLLYNSKCYSSCPRGTYQQEGTCDICDASCKECSGPYSNNCSACSNGTYLNPDNTCQSSCPINYTTDQTSETCIEQPVNPIKTSSTEDSITEVYPVYILIAETGLLLMLLFLSSIVKHDTTHKLANFLALMSIVEFSERIMLLIFLVIENGPFADIQFAIVGGFSLATIINSMIFSKLYFDSLIESSITFNMFIKEHKRSFYLLYYLSLIFSINFIRVLYGGLFGLSVLTIPKSLESVSAFRVPLERLSILKVLIINLPHLIQQISLLCTWSLASNSFQIAAFGLGLNVLISAVYLFDWRRSVWKRV